MERRMKNRRYNNQSMPKKPIDRVASKTEEISRVINNCEEQLIKKLQTCKLRGALNHSLVISSEDRSGNVDTDFEILEFFGDSCLQYKISKLLLQTRRFMSPHALTLLRTCIVQNKNLAECFDTLDLGKHLFPQLKDASTLPLKTKADVVEAIIGELEEVATNHAGKSADLAQEASRTLTDFVSYICYHGEKTYFAYSENIRTKDSNLTRDQLESVAKNNGDSAAKTNGDTPSASTKEQRLFFICEPEMVNFQPMYFIEG